jgi:hypothetical protein
MTNEITKSAEQQLIELGGNLWEKGSMRRVYLSLDVLNSITGLGWYLNSSHNKFYFEDGGIYRKCTKKANKHKQYFVGNFTESGFALPK